MNYLVLMKAVPESAVSISASTSRERIPNPADISALETALSLRDLHGGHVCVMTMGPASSENMLRQALARGADSAILLSDPAFAGADTAATSRVLAAAVVNLGGFDLILCGRKTTDGETGQVGPEVATRLNLPCAANCTTVSCDGSQIVCECLCTEGMKRISLPVPAVVSMVYGINSPRLPSLKGLYSANRAIIIRLIPEDLGLAHEECGQAGSPTVVIRTQTKEFEKRHPVFYDEKHLDLLSDHLRRWVS